MADVHLAFAEGPAGFKKLVVVKQIRAAHRGDQELVTMFMDEARIAARLHHPNVVQTHEVDLHQGSPYIAMEFLRGQTMTSLVERLGDAMPLSASLLIFSELLTALHYAHELRDFDGTPLQIVHRDVNPANVFVTYAAEVKLVDFGIAKALDSVAQTNVGVFKGKLAYMAPEQLRHQRVDRRADLFAVGVMLWETLSGRRMWDRVPELEVAKRIDRGELPHLRARVDAPPGLVAVCHQALAIEATERFATALEFRGALEASVRPEPGLLGRTALGRLLSANFEAERFAIERRIEERSRALGMPTEPSALPTPIAYDQSTARVTRPPPEPRRGPPRFEPLTEPRARRSPLRTVVAIGGAVALAGIAVYGGRETTTSNAVTAGLARDAPAVSATNRYGDPDAPIVELSGDIETSATLVCTQRYRLMFNAVVRPGATLTIEAGTVLLGDQETKGTLIVQPGAKLRAEGTPKAPIVFTSERAPHARRPGDWGGVLLLGNAPVNLRDRAGASVRGEVEGLTRGGLYGGDAPLDDSGVLRHVVIECAGSEQRDQRSHACRRRRRYHDRPRDRSGHSRRLFRVLRGHRHRNTSVLRQVRRRRHRLGLRLPGLARARLGADTERTRNRRRQRPERIDQRPDQRPHASGRSSVRWRSRRRP